MHELFLLPAYKEPVLSKLGVDISHYLVHVRAA
jgi:hypothetical protein